MALTLAPAIAPDVVLSFEINPGTLLQFLETRAEKGPRLKCIEGSVTLVSPGMPHETRGFRLNLLILAVCLELGIKSRGLASTTWHLPLKAGDTAYEADAAYYVQNFGRAGRSILPTWPSRSWSRIRRPRRSGPGSSSRSPSFGCLTSRGTG